MLCTNESSGAYSLGYNKRNSFVFEFSLQDPKPPIAM